LIRKRKLTSNDLGEITTSIIPRRRKKNWRKQLCGWCHTPLLVGYFLDGHQITRAKEFCSDACKMKDNRKRRRSRPRHEPLLDSLENHRSLLCLDIRKSGKGHSVHDLFTGC